MATSNINRIARGSFNFKPWVAAKNTSEIVNSYVEKIYKQIPNDFKNDLMKTRVGAPKTENRFPFRKVVLEKFTIPIINNKPISKLRSNGYRSPAMTARNSFVTPPKKLLNKTPNFKIYARCRYTSSVASSKSSVVRSKPIPNNDEEYRKKIYTPAKGMQFQTFRGIEVLPSTNTKYYDNSIISKYTAPMRLFNEVNTKSKTIEVSNTICNDLMFINDVLKKRICLRKQKPPSVEQLEKCKQELSFKGWNHPSIESYNKLKTAPVLKMPRKYNESTALRKSNIKLQTSGSYRYKGYNAIPIPETKKEIIPHEPLSSYPREGIKFKGSKIGDQLSTKRSEIKSYNPREALDFVCLSRAEKRERGRNQKKLQGNLRF
ncbi:uncharacterized protein LOC129911140 isoform X2 [Episyrphus balteatus]|uniref:uncharacterized protein LOC129911140 isoform X2 n=1 Tax=Episyrphus balteatus TaxID=286459 RepID=UPI0024864185|nr:uncharacterized protein LOC129911140 isoform X2 [Episyrphus balteatus]